MPDVEEFFYWFVLVVFCSTTPVVASDTVGSSKIAKVLIDLPLVIDENAQSAIVDKLTSLEKHRFVYLDLAINFASGKKGAQPFAMKHKGTWQDRNGCPELGPLPMGKSVIYGLKPIADYNHLLMSVFTGERVSFPYLDVSCEYVASGSHEQFRVRGFFYVVTNSIPTAVSMQLRPFNPRYDVALEVLAQ